MQVCCIEGCVDVKSDVTYFRFPSSRTQRRRWLDVITTAAKVSDTSLICSRHFLDEEYETIRGKVRLKPKVVPSLYVDGVKKPEPIKKDSDTIDNDIQNEPIENQSTDNKKSDESSSDTDDTESEITKPIKDRRKRHSRDKRNSKNDETAQNNDEESVENGDDVVRRTEPEADSEVKDIEDIITNYQIKQIRPINRIDSDAERIEERREENVTEENIEPNRTEREDEIETIDVQDDKDPVFIEIALDKGDEGDDGGQNSRDCLMVLESVQCEVDPHSLFHPDPDCDNTDQDDDVIDLGEKKEAPISLLTSSDEDEVIIEEPEIEMVEVSDETDEDDVPLVKLLKRTQKHKKIKKKQRDDIAKMMWGIYEYYCIDCHFKTMSASEYRRHKSQHSTALHVCQICSYATSSRYQLVAHMKRHKENKRYKCHQCNFKSRHNIGLMFHLKTHDGGDVNGDKKKKCDKCNYKTKKASDLLKHSKTCVTYVCESCDYSTKRRWDLMRHKRRRHNNDNNEEDEDYIPIG